ncbi:19400_t:CDS:1 [Dentiscutata erythropus]|uniref:19400_t:CDS:1 n=1 Tax=Dentiscutata erythropus TaxID=1348616 RepID=A0A9N9HBG9_9GLOM|nr:19400_t:CDS:1 [Dentiscutata erythropus]
MPREWVNNPFAHEKITKDRERLMNHIKIISEKKFYPKNFLFFGDSGSGKTTIGENLAELLAKEKRYCTKAVDSNYIDEYENEEVLIKHELTHDTWKFEDLLNLCEKDPCLIKQRNKKPIKVVTKYNIFTSQDPFDDIFSFRKRVFDDRNIRSPQKRIGLYRKFLKYEDYTHDYMIQLLGRYQSVKVDYHIFWLEPDKPGDLLDFINGRFNMKFVEGLDLEKAKTYIYDDDFENLYENDGIVYLKREIDMNIVLGGVIGDVDLDNQNFSVYNRYWQSELPDSIVIPKNLDSLNQKLREKIIQQFDLEVEISKKRTTEDSQIESSTKKIRIEIN